MKTVGIKHSTGVYEGNHYDNFIFQTEKPFEDGKGIGSEVKSYKVKRSVLNESFGKEVTDRDISSLIGQEVQFFFNEYQAVTLVTVQQPQKQ